MSRLIATGELTVKTTSKYGLYKLNNYNEYNVDNSQDNSQATVKQQSSNSQATTTKNDKNDKNNIYNIYIKSPTEIEQAQEVFGNVEINKTLEALKNKIGIDDFADSQKWQRIYGKHCFNLLGRLGQEEFVRRLDIILSDSFKRKNCNKIRYIYEQLKGFAIDFCVMKSYSVCRI